MNKVTIEQKAKAYDEALKVASKYKDIHIMFSSIQEEMFPELKESEDKKVRKMVLKAFKLFAEKQSWIGHCLDDIDWDKCIAYLEKQGEQKPAWSEEDEKMLDDIIEASTHHCYLNITDIEWLKSLKERIQLQPKQEWSEEDIDMINWLIRCCEKEHEELCNDKYGHQDIVSDLKRDCRKKWDWFESLKNKVVPQSQWKPDSSMLVCLEYAIKHINKDGDKKILSKLLEQLKQL